MVNVADLGREAAVHAHDLLVNGTAHWESVENIAKLLPHLDVAPALALVVEAIDPRDRSALVNPAEQEQIVRKLRLVRKREGDGLQALLTTVDVIPEEQVIAFRREAAVLEQAEEDVVLAREIATDLQKRLEIKRVLCDGHTALVSVHRSFNWLLLACTITLSPGRKHPRRHTLAE